MMKLEILYEDDDVIVIHKPAGVASESARSTSPDVVSMVRNHLITQARKEGEKLDGPPFVGLVHRLDQPVEGILVLGKNSKATAILSKELSDHAFTKKYYALVEDASFMEGANSDVEVRGTSSMEGAIASDAGLDSMKEKIVVLEDYLEKDNKTRLAKIVPKGKGKTARLTCAKIREDNYVCGGEDAVAKKDAYCIDDKNLLDITLETGRYHQIRIQLSSRGAAIVGDVKYGAKPDGRFKRGQIALCAYELSFTHPATKERMNFHIQPKWACEMKKEKESSK